MKSTLQYIILVLLISLYGCEEYYQPDIEDTSGTLVVEAMLTDQKSKMTVKLSRSINFNETNHFEGEQNAQVFLHAINGETYTFHRIEIGYYESDNIIEAQTGENYYLQIITKDNEEYRSEIEEMMPPDSIKDIQVMDSTQLLVTYDTYGAPIASEAEGIYISVLPEIPTRNDVGFLYQWSTLINYYVGSEAGMETYNYYCWFKRNSSSLYVYDYNEQNTGYSLILDKLHFLSYNYLSPLPIDSSRFEGDVTYIYTSSFYYYLKQYTITSAGAEFWKSVKTQSETSGKLFDPVEEKISSNIYCVSDTTKEAFGFFNTASCTDKLVRVKMGVGKIYNVEVVNYFSNPAASEDCLENEKTEFWY